jgi:hypothetical protein
MTSREYILDDGRKVRYKLSKWTSRETDTPFYTVSVKVYRKRRRFLTLGLTQTWSLVDKECDTRVKRNDEAVRERIKELRATVLGAEERPLDKLLDSVLEEVEPNHNS